jgi:metallo-beta-lactamase class B
MKVLVKTLMTALFALFTLQCSAQQKHTFQPKVVYQSADLVITQVSANTFEHTSFLQTQDFGKVPCNGLIVSNSHEAIVFDTPTNDTSAEALINWITDSLHCRIKAIIPTHFHNDCLGGLNAFHQHHVASYAYFKTIAFAAANKSAVPQNSFSDSLVLKVGNESILAKFFGEGHTRDNVVGYFPAEHVMFGGCLIKELDATKGFLGDANVQAWSATVEKVKKAFPDVQVIIPGHGQYGNKKLLDYTIRLFRVKS